MSRLAGRLRGLGVAADTTLTMVLQGAGAVAAFALQVVILRVLSRGDADLYARTITYLALASAIADFGIAAVVMPRLAVSGGDSPSFKGAIVLRFATILLGWAAINIYLLVRGNHELIFYVNLSYASIFVSARLIGLRQFIDILWRLKGRTYIVTAVAFADILLLTLGVLLLAVLGALTIDRLLTLYAVSSIPGFVLIVWPLWRNGQLRRNLSMPLGKRYYRALLVSAFPVAMMVLASQTFSQLEPLVIEAYLEVGAVAGFRAATAPLSGLMFLTTAISFGLAPVISQLHRGPRRDVDAGEITSVAVRILGTLAIGISAVCYLFGYQIMQIFGPKYTMEAPVLMYYSIANGLSFVVVLFDSFLLAMGYRRQVLVGALVGFVIALVLELALVRGWAVPGLITAKIIAQVAVLLCQVFYLQPRLRAGALEGLRRIAVPAAVLAAALVATGTLRLELRAPIVLVAVLCSLAVARMVTPTELRMLRGIRLSS